MGQPVAVEEKQGASPSVVRFETNRSLTGMGHERFASAAEAVGPRSAAVLARRLFDTGKVAGVHVFSNIVTVTLAPGASAAGLEEIVRDLYQYWKPGMTPPRPEDLVVEAAPEASAAPAADGAPAGDSRIPAHLAERSRLARERWAAKNG